MGHFRCSNSLQVVCPSQSMVVTMAVFQSAICVLPKPLYLVQYAYPLYYRGAWIGWRKGEEEEEAIIN